LGQEKVQLIGAFLIKQPTIGLKRLFLQKNQLFYTCF
jgi:hypothetical protein